jgi:O-antigen ligase
LLGLIPYLVLADLVLTFFHSTLLFPLLLKIVPLKAVYGLHLGFQVFMFALYVKTVRGRIPRFERSLLPCIVVYGAWVLGVTFWLTTPLTGIRRAEALLIPLNFLTFWLAVPGLLGGAEYLRLFRWLTALIATAAALAIGLGLAHATSFLGFPLAVIPEHRGEGLSLLGIFPHHNVAGTFLEFFPALLIYLFLALKPSRASHILLTVMGGLIGINLMLCFSRSAQCVVALSLLPALGLVWRSRWRMHLFALGVAAVAVGLTGILRQPRLSEYVHLGWGLLGRDSYWRETWAQASLRPWTGYGLFNATTQRGQTPHNIFLSHLLYFGMPGLGLFVAVLAAAGRTAWVRLRGTGLGDPAWLLISLTAAVLLQGLIEYFISYPLFFANSLFLLISGFLLSGRALDRPLNTGAKA